MELVLIIDTLEDGDNIGLEDHAGHDNFVENIVDFIAVKDEVELADIFEAFVEGLDEDLNQVEDAEVGFELVDGEDEI